MKNKYYNAYDLCQIIYIKHDYLRRSVKSISLSLYMFKAGGKQST